MIRVRAEVVKSTRSVTAPMPREFTSKGNRAPRELAPWVFHSDAEGAEFGSCVGAGAMSPIHMVGPGIGSFRSSLYAPHAAAKPPDAASDRIVRIARRRDVTR